MKKSEPNELIHESSPYLLQHAYNPVKWHAYNAENLAEAKRLNKPILISIGYSACHWCHVMEHESFEDSAVAAMMNEYFYPIKVDREERPDVDQIYMNAVQMITGSGGWPLNCFALPDGRPFHGGTYYPKKNWIGLLQTVHHEYETNYSKLEGYAEKIMQGLAGFSGMVVEEPKTLDLTEVEQMVSAWKPSFDWKYGGRKTAPKFPLPNNYEFLMHYGVQKSDESVLDFVQLTLDQMADGGIYDQIGGGFARYSVDEKWKAPHFEKMLYDNAQLLSLYAQAYSQFKNPQYREVVEGIVSFVNRELTDETGLLYSALDADSEGEEGKFYVWKQEELKLILTDDELHFLKEVYLLDSKDEWEHGNFILQRFQTDKQVSEMVGATVPEVINARHSINQKLFKAREARIRPGLDDKTLTSWNAMYFSGLIDAAISLDQQEWLKSAEQKMDVLWNKQWSDGFYHVYKAGKSSIKGLLEDEAFYLQASLKLFAATGKDKWFERSKLVAENAVTHYYDSASNQFYMVSDEQKDLVIKPVEVFDNVIPAVSSVITSALMQIDLISDVPLYQNIVNAQLQFVQDKFKTYPSGYSNWALASMIHIGPFYEVVFVGKDAEDLRGQFIQSYRSNCISFASSKKSDLPIFKDRFVKGKTLIYVCEKGACLKPVESLAEVLSIIK